MQDKVQPHAAINTRSWRDSAHKHWTKSVGWSCQAGAIDGDPRTFMATVKADMNVWQDAALVWGGSRWSAVASPKGSSRKTQHLTVLYRAALQPFSFLCWVFESLIFRHWYRWSTFLFARPRLHVSERTHSTCWLCLWRWRAYNNGTLCSPCRPSKSSFGE